MRGLLWSCHDRLLFCRACYPPHPCLVLVPSSSQDVLTEMEGRRRSINQSASQPRGPQRASIYMEGHTYDDCLEEEAARVRWQQQQQEGRRCLVLLLAPAAESRRC